MPGDPANPTDRALARQKGSYACLDKAELAALIRGAGSAARLHISTKGPEAQEIQDILFALSGALERGDAKLRKALHGPALKDLADRQVAEEKAVFDGKSPDSQRAPSRGRVARGLSMPRLLLLSMPAARSARLGCS
jgi:hypothetical protein